VSAYHDDLSGFGAINNNGHNGLGQEYTLSDDGQLSPTNLSSGHGGSSGGSTSTRAPAPTPSLVTEKGSDLSIWLVWDSSVASAPSGFQTTIEAAAQALVDALGKSTVTPDVVYIDVGWGEIAGNGMSPSALGESETNGYLTTDAVLTSALVGHGDTLGGSNAPSSTTQFFVPTAEGRALGISGISAGSASSPDGYIGIATLGKGYSWQYTDANGNPLTPATSSWYSLYGDALHELSEAMGRISMEGLETFHGHKTYTPLDLFDYAGTPATNPTHALALSNTGGYFSANGGATASGIFNDAKATPGDIADWASYNSPTESGTTVPNGEEDAFNAFGFPNTNDVLSPEDVLLMQTLGY
jgi:hypothetical protein